MYVCLTLLRFYANNYNGWDLLNTIYGNQSVSPQTISHAVTTENHFFRVKCDHVQGKFAYAINMYCEIVLNSSYIGAVCLLFCLKVSCGHPIL